MSRPAVTLQRGQLATLALLSLLLAALGGVGFWAWQNRRGDPPPPFSGVDAETHSRRIDVTLDDVQATWARLLRADGRAYAPVAHSFFVGVTPSACAGAKLAAGSFYCAIDHSLRFDLGFFAAMTPQLLEIEETAGKLVVAYLGATAVQDQLGFLAAVETRGRGADRRERAAMELALALQADCLTGVWARDALRRLGPVDAGLYERAVQGTRRIAETQASWGPAAEVRSRLDLGDKAAREAAFVKGYVAGAIAACLSPDPAHLEKT